jgi:hypothetical protein
METFPRSNTILHHVVLSITINQSRCKPNQWVNKITHKLINAHITSIGQLKLKINNGTLNDYLYAHDMPILNAVTGKVRVEPRAISKIYNWDGQTLCS